MSGLSGLPEQRLRPAYRQALRRELIRFVVEAPGRARRRRQRRVLGSIAAALAGTAGGAVAYSAITSQRPVTDQQVVRCYSVAAYHPGNTFPGASVGAHLSQGDALGNVTVVIQTCAALWSVGVLQPGVATAQHNPPRIKYAVPELVECVLPNGQAAVFPGPAQCLALGLQEPLATPVTTPGG